ncbi:terminase [Nocardioides sp. WS12]|uniref:terminase n=1 Tax=Nocardioides sp. WS12 TaxID=2486272 RepID=UPI0015FA11FB|nr:terminase [Nocardioides sp. WS12]
MPTASVARVNPAPLVEIARHCVIPEDIAFTRFYELIAPELPGMGITLDQWQQDIWEIALGLRLDGTLCCDVMGVTLSIARQAGKTWGVMVGLVAICLARPGTTVVWSSHHDRTSSETLSKIAGIVEKPAIRPKMRPQYPVVFTDDNRGVHFANGSRILFGARSSGFGRGFSEVDIQVYDECQNLKESALTDMLAAMNVSDIGLAFFMGTPPRPQEARLGVDEAFKRRRKRAIEVKKPRPYKGVFVEFSADRGAPLDIQADGFWQHLATANPSFGFRVGESAIERLVENMSPEDVLREVLGIWDETAKSLAVIPASTWTDLAADGPPDGTAPSSIGVDASHDGVLVVAACWREDDSSHVELLAVDNWADDEAAADWIAGRAGRRIPITIDSASPAARLVPLLKNRRCKVNAGSAGDMAKGCGGLYAAALGQLLTHAGQAAVNDALTGAKKRAIGQAGGWGWDRRDPDANIAPLVAVTLAHYGASTSPKSAGRAVFA